MPTKFLDKNGLSIRQYVTVKNPWQEGGEADVVAFDEQDTLVLLDLHNNYGLTGFPPQELEILEPDREKRIELRMHVIERRQNASLIGMVKALVQKSSQHAERYKEAVPSTLALFDALQAYLKVQMALYEQMPEKQKELFYPGGTVSETEMEHFFASLRIFLGLSHVPHGDDPDLFGHS